MTEEVQTLVSSVPGVYERFVELVREACANEEKPTTFFDFDIINFEPTRYVIVTGVVGPRWEWEGIGTFEQKEHFSITGYATIFSGDSPANNPNLALEQMLETFQLFQRTVQRTVFSNRNQPILGTTGPSPYLVLPQEAKYDAGPGSVDGAPAGWASRLDWAFGFSSILRPSTPE